MDVAIIQNVPLQLGRKKILSKYPAPVYHERALLFYTVIYFRVHC